jgi:hypothetical protein
MAIEVPTQSLLGGIGGCYASRKLVAADPIGYLNSTFIVRLQSHLPNNKTPLGLFTDVAGTTPCVNESDPVRCWKDMLSGSSIKFTEATNYPTLHFVNGYPTVKGSLAPTLILTASASFAPISLFTVAKGTLDESNFGRIANSPSGTSGINDDSFGPNLWGYVFNGTQYTVAMTSNFDALGMQGGTAVTQTSINGVTTSRADGNMADVGNWTLFNNAGEGQTAPGPIVAIIFGNQSYNSTDWANINNYLASLKPS